MKALVYKERLLLDTNYPRPAARSGWAVIHVRVAGICRTDIELTRGYMGFQGVLGHEFVGVVADSEDPSWAGCRVVGEINAACGRCEWCAGGLGRHCPHRSVLGIAGLDGCMAESCTLPVTNLQRVPDELPDDAAVFTEPVSAAAEILEQVPVRGSDRCVVLGDGKLGILCAWVLLTRSSDVTLIGHHPEKLQHAQWQGLKTCGPGEDTEAGADLVVDATGSVSGLEEALRLCRPRGTLVLKSTLAAASRVNLAPLVVDEVTLVGSRCGRFEEGLRLLQTHRLPVQRLISDRFPIDEGLSAFHRAGEPGVLKVLLDMPG
jgi:alcohol dehydrogenase